MTQSNYVLLIDDDEATNFVNDILIKKSNVAETTQSVQNAREALKFIEKCVDQGNNLPDKIFLDINMPEFTGWDFLVEYAKIDQTVTNQIEVYMLSSSQNEEDVILADKNPLVKGFLHKPLTSERLMALFNQPS